MGLKYLYLWSILQEADGDDWNVQELDSALEFIVWYPGKTLSYEE